MDENSSERCVLCLDKKYYPVPIQCGHSFCSECLNVYKSYKKYPWANKCPICRNDLKDTRKGIKRKYPDQNSEPHNSVNTFVIETQINSSNAVQNESFSPSQQNNILEEFMALATNYIEDNQENSDTSFNSYESLNGTMTNSTQENANYDDDEYATQTDYDELDDSYDDELNFYTQFEEYSVYHDFNDDHNYYSFEEDARGNTDDYYSQVDYHEEYEETSFINVVDDEAEYVGDGSNIDWETVIASDVIIIDQS